MAEVDAENGSFEAVSPSSRSGAPESGQAISGLAKILQDHGVQHSLAKHLLDEGWDTQSFRHVVCTASEFDGVLVEMFGGTAVPLDGASAAHPWAHAFVRGFGHCAEIESGLV